jgi:hypothetical protein
VLVADMWKGKLDDEGRLLGKGRPLIETGRWEGGGGLWNGRDCMFGQDVGNGRGGWWEGVDK